MNNHKRSQTIVIIVIISMASYYISNAHSHWKEIKWGEKNNYRTMWKSRKRKIGKPSNSITTVIFPMKRNSHLWCWYFITNQKMKPWGEKKKNKKGRVCICILGIYSKTCFKRIFLSSYIGSSTVHTELTLRNSERNLSPCSLLQ